MLTVLNSFSLYVLFGSQHCVHRCLSILWKSIPTATEFRLDERPRGEVHPLFDVAASLKHNNLTGRPVQFSWVIAQEPETTIVSAIVCVVKLACGAWGYPLNLEQG